MIFANNLQKMDKFIANSDSEEERVRDLGSDEEFFASGGKMLDSDEDVSDFDNDLESKTIKKKSFDAFDQEDDNEEDDFEERPMTIEEKPKKPEEKTEEDKNVNELYRKSKLLKHKNKQPKGKTGVVYLSKIPPYMKPTKMRQILARFGEVDRLFLKRESQVKHKQRIKSGGNKKINYEEGWAEFIRKKDAKLCAETLNGNKLGGKKGSFYYDDIMNVKYLSGFKWADLTEQMSRENEARQSKLQMEISQAHKLNKAFVKNVEKSKMIENIQNKKKERAGASVAEDKKTEEIRRTFEQRRVRTSRADGPEKYKGKNNEKLENVLSNVF